MGATKDAHYRSCAPQLRTTVLRATQRRDIPALRFFPLYGAADFSTPDHRRYPTTRRPRTRCTGGRSLDTRPEFLRHSLRAHAPRRAVLSPCRTREAHGPVNSPETPIRLP